MKNTITHPTPPSCPQQLQTPDACGKKGLLMSLWEGDSSIPVLAGDGGDQLESSCASCPALSSALLQPLALVFGPLFTRTDCAGQESCPNASSPLYAPSHFCRRQHLPRAPAEHSQWSNPHCRWCHQLICGSCQHRILLLHVAVQQWPHLPLLRALPPHRSPGSVGRRAVMVFTLFAPVGGCLLSLSLELC